MKILIVPDSFKGSATSTEVARAIQKGVNAAWPDARITLRPLADGGEGSLEVLHHVLQGDWINVDTVDPLGRSLTARYLRVDECAYIELAEASGLQLLATEERDGAKTTTVGTGRLIRHAVDQGCSLVFLFVGGSATNDAGTGLATALGYRFLDSEEQEFVPTGATLAKIERIIVPEEGPSVTYQVLCDVSNLFTGQNGATFIYGPQKGIIPKSLSQVEEGMEHLRKKILGLKGVDLNMLPGSGAAG
ncbi:MAG: glycerate kinase, partial [Saprospiraceae bacterium]|nr:glycerate kinase [Saprospiraceae bacterium]